MLQASIHHEQVAGGESVLLPCRAEPDITVQDVHGDGATGAMGGYVPPSPYHHERHPEQPLLQERAGVSAVAFGAAWGR